MIDYNDVPANRPGVSCLNCGRLWFDHHNWQCRPISERDAQGRTISDKDKLPPNKCYLTPDMIPITPPTTSSPKMKLKDVPVGTQVKTTTGQGDESIAWVVEHSRNSDVLLGWKNGEKTPSYAWWIINFCPEHKGEYIRGWYVGCGYDCEVIASTNPTNLTIAPANQVPVPAWKSWANVLPGHCPCGMPKEQCEYHRA